MFLRENVILLVLLLLRIIVFFFFYGFIGIFLEGEYNWNFNIELFLNYFYYGFI